MSTELVVPEVENNELTTGKRGLDVAKVDFIMAREQERDLRIVYRVDQLELFCKDPAIEARKRYNAQRKPSDPPLIQAGWEAHDNYMQAKRDGDQKGAIEWFKQLQSVLTKAQDLRKEAMDRLFAWKKQAEAQGRGVENLSNEELEALGRG